MTLQTDFPNLRVMVSSQGDTTLVIRGPDGTYRCDDDSGGSLNPLVAGAFASGTYQVYVGTFTNTESPPFTIGFSELDSVTPASLANR